MQFGIRCPELLLCFPAGPRSSPTELPRSCRKLPTGRLPQSKSPLLAGVAAGRSFSANQAKDQDVATDAAGPQKGLPGVRGHLKGNGKS